MRYYIAGPMTGLRDSNRPAFKALREQLRAQGHFVICPTELDFLPADPSASDADVLWRGFLTRDVAIILTSDFDAIVMLEGWKKSRGARLELMAALTVGLGVLRADTMREIKVGFLEVRDLEGEEGEEGDNHG